MGAAKIFLSAEWRYLAMLNYAIDPNFLEPYVPEGTELDTWEGQTYVSMVGFLFQDTRVLGIPIPFHRDFEEVNLRFYVRRRVENEWRRGVVFIKEIVPMPAIAIVARALYGENYAAMPMGHAIEEVDGVLKPGGTVEYRWGRSTNRGQISVSTQGEAQALVAGSHEEFIAEHYWGYTKRRNGATLEYEVEHPPWKVWQTQRATFEADIGSLYGDAFAERLDAPPDSAFLAEGSRITVRQGTKII